MNDEDICFILHGLKEKFEKIDFVIRTPFNLGDIMTKYEDIYGERLNKKSKSYSNDQTHVYGLFFDRQGDDVWRLFLGEPDNMYSNGVEADMIINSVDEIKKLLCENLKPIPLTEEDLLML